MRLPSTFAESAVGSGDIAGIGTAEGASHLARRLVTTALLAALAAAGVTVCGSLMGMQVPRTTLVILVFGALAMELVPRRSLEMATVVGVLALASVNKVYAAYHVIMVAGLYLVRHRSLALAAILFGAALLLPKFLFQSHYHQPGFYNWLNEPSLALAIFVTARWWRDKRDGRLPAAATRASLPAFAALYLFPSHAVNPIVYGASDLFRRRRTDVKGVLSALLLLTTKALVHAAIVQLVPQAQYAHLDATRVDSSTTLALWGIVLVNYLDLALILSGTADLAVMIARLYGWPMPSPFRWALLAWNPIELWRRWGLYNRRFLLGFFYHPLGGGRRHRTLNVLLTFLASAWVMHSGWFGSKYWEVGVAGWRDQAIYFLMQGLAVCGCLAYRQWRQGPPRGGRVDGGEAPREQEQDRELRWSWGRLAGTAATQATSALIHVVILAQALPLSRRFALIGRCLGLGWE